MGHRSIAVPLRMNDRVVAALGIGCVAARVTVKLMVDDYLPRLQATADQLSEVLTASERTGELVLTPWR